MLGVDIYRTYHLLRCRGPVDCFPSPHWTLRSRRLDVSRSGLVHPHREGEGLTPRWHRRNSSVHPQHTLCQMSYPCGSPLAPDCDLYTCEQAAEPVFSTILTGLVKGSWAPWKVTRNSPRYGTPYCSAATHVAMPDPGERHLVSHHLRRRAGERQAAARPLLRETGRLQPPGLCRCDDQQPRLRSAVHLHEGYDGHPGEEGGLREEGPYLGQHLRGGYPTQAGQGGVRLVPAVDAYYHAVRSIQSSPSSWPSRLPCSSKAK